MAPLVWSVNIYFNGLVHLFTLVANYE